jgi:hypothetical protein
MIQPFNITVKRNNKEHNITVLFGMLFTILVITAIAAFLQTRRPFVLHKAPTVIPCNPLFHHVTTKDELINMLLARPECGALFTRSFRDSLYLDAAQ